MPKKVLIANRGEIAVRIARSVREIGCIPISVYSDVDRLSLHVLLSDISLYLGPADPRESYLNIDRIIELAKEAGADMVHPGYGFLAENPKFAEALEKNGLTFIGPPSHVLALVGNKVEARKVAERAGVPVIPGTPVVKDLNALKKKAKSIGFPLLLKAALGGGGKGMRIIESEDELESAFSLATEEAASAFGEPDLYIEKYLEDPRHVEVQVLRDSKGNTVTLGERECSIQRRHQKIIEESPSPAIDEKMRKEMEEAARAVMEATGYINAGTVEFLVKDGKFYFLEVNARIQVEHPVTEMRFGVDLVREQIRIAEGGSIKHLFGIEPRGHAIEARIYAEDPENNFFPSPGRILWLWEPRGPNLRVDSGIYPGWEVPIHYDPLLSKVIAWAENRKRAVRRLDVALGEYRIMGITTNVPFHRAILKDERFVKGEIHINFLRDFAFTTTLDSLILGVAGVVKEKLEKPEWIEGEKTVSNWRGLSWRNPSLLRDWEVLS
jgi:acetyl-CoA carboxylase biotin carboxylase subunit